MILIEKSVPVAVLSCVVLDFAEDRITKLLNTELADNLGNMLNRVTGVKVNPSQTYPPFHVDLFPLYTTSSPQCRASSEDYELLNAMNNLTGQYFVV